MVVHLDLSGVADDRDRVAFGFVVIRYHVDTKPIDPVIVDVLVLTCDAVPMDHAVIHRVFGQNIFLAVDQSFELEAVGAATANKDIVGFNFLIDPIYKFQILGINGAAFRARRIVQNQLSGALFARVGAAD